MMTPKSILKKVHQQPSSIYHYQKTTSLLNNVPKIIPRTNIKQSKQNESLF